MSTLALEINDTNVLLIKIYVVNFSIAEANWFVKNKVSPRQRGTSLIIALIYSTKNVLKILIFKDVKILLSTY